MNDSLTKEDIKEAVREAMAEKFEVTFGVDCHTPEGRVSLREDMAFRRALRVDARKGGEKIFWWFVGIAGTGAIAWFWPEINKHLK
jgi:hypothetical protein